MLVLRHSVHSIVVHPRADQLQSALSMQHGLVVLVKLRENSTNIEVRSRNGDVVSLQRDLDLQGFA
jgi:hypothetical protein